MWVIDRRGTPKRIVSQGGGSFSRFCRWGALVANSVWSYWLPFSSSCGSSARQKPEFFWSLGFVVQERRPGRRCPGAEAWASLSRSGGLVVVEQNDV